MPERADIEKLCVHTMTTKPWSLQQAVEGYFAAGVRGITVWRQHLEPVGIQEGARMLAGSGLDVVSLCRGGFFVARDAAGRQAAVDDNLRAIDEAEAIGAPLVVLVCGAAPGVPLDEARAQIRDGIAACLDHARDAGVRLSIEPLHPMYADCRSAVVTLGQANDIVQALGSPWLGVTVDVYHVWWDPDLEREIARAGASICSFHVCDWRTPTRDLLNDRTLMGAGCIDIPRIRGWVEAAGFDGFNEVEIFSEEYWGMDQPAYLDRIRTAYLEHV